MQYNSNEAGKGAPISRLVWCAAASVAIVLSACGGGGGADVGGSGSVPAAMACDDSLTTAFRADPGTSVLLVKAFKSGDPVALANSPTLEPAPVAAGDMCLVKLLVGPGAPGTAGAPSTSPGIGIEVWLPAPAAWNQIVRTYGGGGWGGGFHAETTRLSGSGAADAIHMAAVGKGYVVSTSDHGHGGTSNAGGSGTFAMLENGGINTRLWQDFSERSIHELALKTKALVAAYYGRPQKFAYWDGYSTGGRQGYKLAQKFPGDYSGILAGAPAFNWTQFIIGEFYPQVVMRQDTGGPIDAARLNAVTTAAAASCGGASLGFMLDPLQCRYDPTRDPAALCAGVAGTGVTGTSANATTCVNLAQARAINKIWYGQTTDGSYVDPAIDNAGGPTLGDSRHLWFGQTRGSSLSITAGPVPFPISTDLLALVLQDPAYAQDDFINATGNGSNKWRTVDYAGIARAFNQGLALQPAFSHINTDDPDLSALRASGAKVLSYHGLADDFIMTQGSIHYFARAAAAMGGDTELQKFNRLFLIPALAHDSALLRVASYDPATGALTAASKVPLPQSATGRDELFNALRNWVENGVAPGRIELSSADGNVTLPICPWPQKITYRGSGPVTASSSYACS